MQEPPPILADPRDTTRSVRLPECDWPRCHGEPTLSVSNNDRSRLYGCAAHPLVVITPASVSSGCSVPGCNEPVRHVARFVDGLYAWLYGCAVHPLIVERLLPGALT